MRTGTMEENCKVPNLFLIEYNDGLRAALLMLNGFVFEPSAAAYAARVDGKVEACEVYLEGFPKHRPTDAASRANNFWRYYGTDSCHHTAGIWVAFFSRQRRCVDRELCVPVKS